MKITVIAAVAKNGIIGIDNKIPWDCKGDMEHFKRTTSGGIVVFGHNTWAGLPLKPLPNRTNVVISQIYPKGPQADGSIVFESLAEVLAHFKDASEIFICGGAMLYNATLPIADELIYTIINAEPDGDTKFPEVDWSKWQKTFSEPHPDFEITKWQRIKSA